MTLQGHPYIRDVVTDVVQGLDPNTDATSLAISPSAPAISGVGTQQLTITATMRDGSTRDVTSTSSYVSATPGKATVSATGLVTGVASGTSVITVTYQGVKATATVTVS